MNHVSLRRDIAVTFSRIITDVNVVFSFWLDRLRTTRLFLRITVREYEFPEFLASNEKRR
jgi:hypothetical protein